MTEVMETASPLGWEWLRLGGSQKVWGCWSWMCQTFWVLTGRWHEDGKAGSEGAKASANSGVWCMVRRIMLVVLFISFLFCVSSFLWLDFILSPSFSWGMSDKDGLSRGSELEIPAKRSTCGLCKHLSVTELNFQVQNSENIESGCSSSLLCLPSNPRSLNMHYLCYLLWKVPLSLSLFFPLVRFSII